MTCTLCGGANIKKEFDAYNRHGRHTFDKNDEFKICRCLGCGVVFVCGMTLDDAYYAAYYPKGYYENGSPHGALYQLIKRYMKWSFDVKKRLILKYLRHTSQNKIRILDVGCGSGAFLNALQDERFEKYGVELNPDGYKSCLEKKINVKNCDLKNVDFEDDFFDVITLWHVVEHLQNPFDTMPLVAKKLKEDGILILATPNIASLGYKWGKEAWFHLDAPRHVVLYDQKNIRLLLQCSGFDVIKETRSLLDYPLDLFWSLAESPLRFLVYPLYPFFKMADVETMMLVCKRIKS